MATDEQRQSLSDEWSDLQQQGKVPEKGKGTTANYAERDKERKRKRMPTENRRKGRKVSPTLSHKLIQRLQAICKAEGHIDPDGEGIIASSVIEDLLWAAVEAYDRGEFEEVKEVVQVRQRLRRRPGNH